MQYILLFNVYIFNNITLLLYILTAIYDVILFPHNFNFCRSSSNEVKCEQNIYRISSKNFKPSEYCSYLQQTLLSIKLTTQNTVKLAQLSFSEDTEFQLL
jgi:hypothetical protein